MCRLGCELGQDTVSKACVLARGTWRYHRGVLHVCRPKCGGNEWRGRGWLNEGGKGGWHI